MPFIANTPESLITRSDSKNPATTCRGITSTGRPCRRPLPTSGATTPHSLDRPRPQCSTMSTICPNRHAYFAEERMYCWQHKEQSGFFKCSNCLRQKSSTATDVYMARNSVDTLAERLQMFDIAASYDAKDRRPARQSQRNEARQKLSIGSYIFCCFFENHSGEVPSAPPRPKQQPAQAFPPLLSPKTGKQQARRPQKVSKTAQGFSLIPTTISHQTTAALMAELTKPVSQMDEPGYIYMFWMTPESQHGAPPTEAMQSLLVPLLRPTGGGGQRSASDAVASFAAHGRGGGQHKDNICISGHQNTFLLLKIGRANNIQRRLNEWKRQCGYNISLIRYYPYIPGSLNGPASPSPRKIPHSHKVERLVHIELTGLGLRVTNPDKCVACGREHREWFRVEGTRDAVSAVDEVIRRWSDWDEGGWQFS